MARFHPRSRHPRLSSVGILAVSFIFSACAGSAVQAPPHKISAPRDSGVYGGSAQVVKNSVTREAPHEGLDIARIDRHLRNRSSKLRSPRPGVWHVSIDGVMVLAIADPDRLRLMAPIFALQQLDSAPKTRTALMIRLLQANFDDTIDARYAIFNGIVFAAISQPRKQVRVEAGLDRFLTQVVNLHKNTFRVGTGAYSSAPPDPESFEVDPRADKSLPFQDGDEPDEAPKKDALETPELPDGRTYL